MTRPWPSLRVSEDPAIRYLQAIHRHIRAASAVGSPLKNEYCSQLILRRNHQLAIAPSKAFGLQRRWVADTNALQLVMESHRIVIQSLDVSFADGFSLNPASHSLSGEILAVTRDRCAGNRCCDRSPSQHIGMKLMVLMQSIGPRPSISYASLLPVFPIPTTPRNETSTGHHANFGAPVGALAMRDIFERLDIPLSAINLA